MRTVDLRHVLDLAEEVAAELAAVALDRGADLSASDRKALMVLSIGIEDAAARATGVLPRSGLASALVLRSMLATAVDNDNQHHEEHGC